MLADIEDGTVGCVIVKDMSRIGRNYLEVGFYTEVLFRKKNVRFIAISNNVDSALNDGSNEFAPFLNIMNEWYVRDTSRKIKSVLHNKGMDGNGPMQVARILKDEKVERPSYYLAKQGLGTCRGSCDIQLERYVLYQAIHIHAPNTLLIHLLKTVEFLQHEWTAPFLAM